MIKFPVLILFHLLIVCYCVEQPNFNYENTAINNYSKKSEVKSSVIFVIDSSSSMGSFLYKIGLGVNKLTHLIEKEETIENYILVVFRDQYLTNETYTTKEEFIHAIRSIQLESSDKCSEDILRAIYEGLTRSSSKAFVYVFTDASPRTLEYQQPIIDILAIKAASIWFFLAGRCSKEADEIFINLADITNGYVFKTSANLIDEVFFRMDFGIPLKDYETFVFKEITQRTDFIFEFDRYIEDLIIFASGTDVFINIYSSDRSHIKQCAAIGFTICNLETKKNFYGKYYINIKASNEAETMVKIVFRSLIHFSYSLDNNGFMLIKILGLATNISEHIGINHVTVMKDNNEEHHWILTKPNNAYITKSKLSDLDKISKIKIFAEDSTGGFIKRNINIPRQVYVQLVVDETPKLKSEGQNVKLICIFSKSTNDRTDVWWKYPNGMMLKAASTSRQNKKTGVPLNIKQIRMDQSGNYTCYINTFKGLRNVTDEKYFYLKVEQTPFSIVTDNTIESTENTQSVTLQCNIYNAFSNISTGWTFNNHTIPINAVQKETHLELHNVTKFNAGSYVCYGRRLNSTIEEYKSSIVTLRVRYKPTEIIIKNVATNESLINKENEINENENITLFCDSDGYPTPSVSWEISSTNIHSSNNLLVTSLPYRPELYEIICKSQNSMGTQSKELFLKVKPILKWTHWSEFSSCSTTCGFGFKKRTRKCVDIKGNVIFKESMEYYCNGDQKEFINCYEKECPIDGGWSDWGKWSDCPKCRSENKTYQISRARFCNNPTPKYNGTECNGTAVDLLDCQNSEFCPIDAKLSEWSPWSVCSVTCGNGVRRRTRTCIPPKYNGLPCGSLLETISCSIDCVKMYGPSKVQIFIENENVNLISNPAVYLNELQKYTIICKSSGTPKPTNTWVLTNTAHYTLNTLTNTTNKLEISLNYQKDAYTFICQSSNSFATVNTTIIFKVKPILNWSDWTQWSSCSKTCNGGSQTRYRDCMNINRTIVIKNTMDYYCDGDKTERRICGTKLCPINGNWGDWKHQNKCPNQCRDENNNKIYNVTYIRECNNPSPQNGGLTCKGSSYKLVSCELKPCPIDGKLVWSPWSICNVSCNEGMQYKTPRCEQPRFGGRPCPKASPKYRKCFVQCNAQCDKKYQCGRPNDMRLAGICKPTSLGYYCDCANGLEWNSRANRCEDINECESQNRVCEHMCDNTWGSYRCYCHQNFNLNDDQITCSKRIKWNYK